MENIFQNKKVMVLCTTDNMITQFLLPHIRDMQEMGAQVECVCARTGKWFDEIVAQGIVCHEINFKRNPIKFANLKAYRKLVKLQKVEKYDLIYCQQPVGGLMGRLLGKKFKKQVIYTAHGFAFMKNSSFKKKLVFRTAEKWLAKHTDVLITINQEDFEEAQSFAARKVYKISGIGLNLDKFAGLEYDKDAFRKSLGIEKDEKVILSVAELVKGKNYKTMLNVIFNLRFEKIKYLICGTGRLESKLKSRVKKLGLEDKVVFLGYRKDIPEIMGIADLFLHCSFREGLTMAIMEAMNSSLAVVASDCRGNRDLIDDGKGGFICPCKDEKMIAEKIRILLKDDNLRKDFGLYNAQRVKAYSYDNVKEELRKIYAENIK